MPDTISILIGAASALATGYMIEAYKRNRDKRIIAAAFLGEIRAIIEMSEKFGMEKYLEKMIATLENESTVSLLRVPPNQKPNNIVFEKCADKIGILPKDVVILISEFYYLYSTVALTWIDIHSGGFANNPDRLLVTLKSLRKVAESGQELGKNLVTKLMVLSG